MKSRKQINLTTEQQEYIKLHNISIEFLIASGIKFLKEGHKKMVEEYDNKREIIRINKSIEILRNRVSELEIKNMRR